MAQAAILAFFLFVFNKTTPGGNWGQQIGCYQGVIAYSNGCDSGSYSLAEPITPDGPLYQCDEYCRRFYRLKYGMDTSGWEYNTKDWYRFSRVWGLKRYPNNGTSLPQPTDILCFNYEPFGHVAIVTSVDGKFVNIIQQNASPDTAYGKVAIINGIVQDGCLGWLRKGKG